MPNWEFVSPSAITAYANDRTAAADAYIHSLGTLTSGLVPPAIVPTFPTINNPTPPGLPERPEITTISWTAPSLPTKLSATIDISDILPEPFDDSPPELVFPAAPADPTATLPDPPQISLDFVYPDVDVQLPAAPQLMSISTYRFDGVNIPSFDVDVPELQLAEPTITPYVPGENYTSALLTTCQNTLAQRISEGGTGLPPAVEQAIWDRGREREVKQLQDGLAALDQMEELGYAQPPGAYLDGRLKLQTEFAAASAGYSREVMIKQAELEQENIKHALTTAVTLEQALIQYRNQVEQRTFESCKYATEAGVSIYNAKVQAYTAYVKAYEVKIEVYKAQIQGELAKVQAYQAEMEAERTKAQVNQSLVQQYEAQIRAALANIDIFKAKVDIIRTKADIEKTKVEVFGEQVRAFTAQINAFTAQVEAYKSRVQAEEVKQSAFKSVVEVYKTRVEAATSVIQARISEFKAQVDAKVAEYDGYKAAVSGEAARVQSIATSNTAIVEGYKAEVTANSAYYELLTKQWQVALDEAMRVSEIAINTAKMNAELYVTVRSLAMEASKVGAQVSAQLGAAAVNAVTYSQSLHNNSSFSESTSQSTNRNYNYNM